ncbi:MAG TPA: phosphate signaling complex protein PhoU [Verrucomicrobiae bacterium]|nr:phosphate signaling complex protein PhoU [Verrucomicrobiae bacterium]
MELHFDQELSQLKDALLRMSAMAEQSVAQSLKALVQRDGALARQVDTDDTSLDRLQMEIDERSVQLIALRQPKARDLRFIVMTMKIAAELERIGDQAVNIAHRAEELNKEPLLKSWVNIPRMAEITRGMIHDTLDAFVYEKPDAARAIIGRDDEVDALNQQLHRELTSYIIEDPHTITRALNLMSVAHNLERIGDHATNIAEEVVYLYEARDIRHQRD